MQKSNLEILQELKKEYNPDTAFGNPILIKLIKRIKLPNKKGEFETFAEIHSQKIINIEWQCVNCGCCNILDVEDVEVKTGDEVNHKCENCKKKHKLEIISDF